MLNGLVEQRAEQPIPEVIEALLELDTQACRLAVFDMLQAVSEVIGQYQEGLDQADR